MKTLAIDCAGNSCSAAVIAADKLMAHRFVVMERGQAESLMPMIAAVLAEAAIGVDALDLLAVATGPGGFTGLRIALATAQGLALATGLPLLGVTCFEAVAAAVPAELRRDRAVVVALESKREELFLQAFAPAPGRAALVAQAGWATVAPAGPVVVAGDGAPRFAAALGRSDIVFAPGPGLADAADVGRIAIACWNRGERPPALPLYLRAPDVTRPVA